MGDLPTPADGLCLCGCGRPARTLSNYHPARFWHDNCRRRYRYMTKTEDTRTCNTCGDTFPARGSAKNCPRCVRKRPGRNKREEYARLTDEDVIEIYRPNPCATCLLGERHPAAEGGYICRQDIRLQCRPHGPALAYRGEVMGTPRTSADLLEYEEDTAC